MHAIARVAGTKPLNIAQFALCLCEVAMSDKDPELELFLAEMQGVVDERDE